MEITHNSANKMINQPSHNQSAACACQEAIQTCSEKLNIPRQLLITSLNSYADASSLSLLQLLHMAMSHSLDPVNGEIILVKNRDFSWQTIITMDGWIKLINQHPHYQGMSLRDSHDETNGIPNWMECCIYRDDRILPIVVKEYLSEVKSDHELWITMPRRMLRHRVIQQCARLAFGISSPEQVTKSAIPTPMAINQTINPTGSNNLPEQLIVRKNPPDLDKNQSIPCQSRSEWLKHEILR